MLRAQRISVLSFIHWWWYQICNQTLHLTTWLESNPRNRIKWQTDGQLVGRLCVEWMQQATVTPAAKRRTDRRSACYALTASVTSKPTDVWWAWRPVVIGSLMTALLQSVQRLVRCYWLRPAGRHAAPQRQDWCCAGKLATNRSVGAAC